MRANLGDVPTLAWPFTGVGLRDLRDTVNRIIAAINGDLLSALRTEDIQTVTFPSANTDTVVPHSRGRVPLGILVLNVDTDGSVVRADSARWTSTYIVLRCSVAGTVALVVVV